MNYRTKVSAWVVTFLVAACAPLGARGDVVYVKSDATGNNDGTSWTDAYDKLQDALANAVAGDDIWVASGTYYPDEGAGQTNDDRDSTFTLKDSVNLYGGFVGDDTLACTEQGGSCSGKGIGDACGTAGTCDPREFKCYDCDNDPCEVGTTTCSNNDDCPSDNVCLPSTETVLSGDLDQDDGGGCRCDSDCTNGYCVNQPLECYEECECEQTCPPWPPNNYCPVDDCDGAPESGLCLLGNNSYHVVTYQIENAATEPVFDGFVVQNGKADGTGVGQDQGGAVHIRKAAICDAGPNQGEECNTDDDCPSGGACIADKCIDGGPALKHSTFRNNFASNHAAVNDHGHTTTLERCAFIGNNSDDHAGALLVEHGSTSVTASLFARNTTKVDGGATWFAHADDPTCIGSSAPSISACYFSENATNVVCPTKGGGAISVGADTTLTVADCIFNRNRGHTGGAIWAGGPSIEVTRSRFDGNVACFTGGAFSLRSSAGNNGDATILNSLFVNNQTRDTPGRCDVSQALGGAVAHWPDIQNPPVGTLSLTNCTVADNLTYGYHEGLPDHQKGGGGGVGLYGGNLVARNCVFWGNRDGYTESNDEEDQIYWFDGHPSFEGDVDVAYSDVEDELPDATVFPGSGNIDDDPTFVSGAYSLDTGSPCIDAGTNCDIEDHDADLAGNRRRYDDSGTSDTGLGQAPMVDMGSYEFGASAASCGSDVDCGIAEICCYGACTSDECCDDCECGAGELCCSGTCQGCCNDNDCPGTHPYCSSGSCEQCLEHSHCSGQLCCINNKCVIKNPPCGGIE